MNKDGRSQRSWPQLRSLASPSVYLMQWFGYGTLAVGVAAFGAAIAVYVIGGIFFPD